MAGALGSLIIGFFKYEVFNNPPPSSPKKESMFNEDIKLDIKFDFEQYTK